jgi:hypothetical protein
VTTLIEVLLIDASQSPAKVVVKVSPKCPKSGWGGVLECKINRRTGSVFSIAACDAPMGDEHEED